MQRCIPEVFYEPFSSLPEKFTPPCHSERSEESCSGCSCTIRSKENKNSRYARNDNNLTLMLTIGCHRCPGRLRRIAFGGSQGAR
jgi:hypothetical protein